MFIVKDAVTHDAYLKALAKPHGYVSRVDVWYNGEKIKELDFATALESGSVTVTSRNRERRGLTLVARESMWPKLPNDPLSPYGVWLQAFVTVTAGLTKYGPIPAFAGKLDTTRRKRRSGQIMVRAVDPFWQINNEPIESPRQAPPVAMASAARTLLSEVFPSATLTDSTTVAGSIPDGTVWNAGSGSRGRVLDEIAAAVGAELFALPTAVWPGGDFVLRPVPGLNGIAVWTVDGEIVEADEQLLSGSTVVNRWIVTVERPDAPTIYLPVTETDPASPTRYGGPMGKLADFYPSPLITNQAQALAAGMAKLNRSKGAARTRRLSVMANPAIEAGDLLSISIDGEPAEYHIVDDIDLPLTPESASMTLTTRASGGDQ